MIWLVGDKGMLGSELAAALAEAGIDFVGSGREVDILDPAVLAAFTLGKDLSWIVNCVAYTSVDEAEDEVELAMRLNAEGPGNLAALASRIGACLLHVSTDYVFDGTGTRPYVEDDPVNPRCVYGRSKAEGEARVRAALAEHVILRTAWLYGKTGSNFVSIMLKLMSERERIGVVVDQRGTPTYVGDLARAIAVILGSVRPSFGSFHYANLGETCWYEFALEIKRLGLEYGILSRDCPIDALTTDQYPTKAKRPAYVVLSKDKIREAYRLQIPEWQISLALCMKEMRG
jgi:dTDP-4-dehydrorhamnose reductase